MASKDPAFLFYTADFYAGISDLTMEERGQYITLLCLQHLKGHLSAKNIKIAVGTVSEDVLDKFTQDQDNLYYNERLEIEINKRKKYSETLSANAKSGWEKRNANANAIAYANAEQTHMQSENENINVNKSINDSKNINIVNIDLFNTIWKRYPRKENKQAAYKAFEKLKPDMELIDTIKKAIEKSRRWKRWNDPQFIPHFSTWLNQRRWEDEIPESELSSFDIFDIQKDVGW